MGQGAGQKLGSCELCARVCKYERAVAERDVDGEFVPVCQAHRDGLITAKLSKATPDFGVEPDAPYQKGSPGSLAGARVASGKVYEQAVTVLHMLVEAGDRGLTEAEITNVTDDMGLKRCQITRTLTYLKNGKALGFVAAEKRGTRPSITTGVSIQVNVATDAGRAFSTEQKRSAA